MWSWRLGGSQWTVAELIMRTQARLTYRKLQINRASVGVSVAFAGPGCLLVPVSRQGRNKTMVGRALKIIQPLQAPRPKVDLLGCKP